MSKTTRRQFFQKSLAGASLLVVKNDIFIHNEIINKKDENLQNTTNLPQTYGKPLDLAPAKWIWLPAGRTLPNSFVFFRKNLTLNEKPTKATGWILGDSRYKLYLNAERIQWGPAPFDPRWAEADPVDFTAKLTIGDNLIGAEVLYYGFGDGTWPIGKPGFIFKLDIEYASGRTETLVSDETWQVKIANAWKPGQYKRWYLRSLQEEFDARLYPFDWHKSLADDPKTGIWFSATAIVGALPQKPIIASWEPDYLYDSGGGDMKEVELRQRSVAMLTESLVPIKKLSEELWLKWKIPPDQYFQFALTEALCFDIIREKVVAQNIDGIYTVNFEKDWTAVLTFEFDIQSVGFPYFTMEASEGTVVELLVHEAHEVNSQHALINTHFNSWSKFVCKEGVNHFEVFDYESLRWLQLHVRNARGTVKISQIGMRRRQYPFPNPPEFKSSDPKLEQLFSACVNTMYNNSQETIVDGMARERQQYSGDLGHMVHGIYRTFGEVPMLARFLNTYSQGLTKAGFFLDTWPAYDRLARLMEREIGVTGWGPILDHGVGFNFDCWHYYQYTGDMLALKEVYPRLKIFFNYLISIQKIEGTMPVEDLGIPCVWIDHLAYKQQKHKECAFGLYVAAMCLKALPVLARAFDDQAFAQKVLGFGTQVLKATQKKFWDSEKKAFICNKPYIREEGEIRYCDRSLGMAVLYDLNPVQAAKPGEIARYDAQSITLLAERPPEMGLSYPTNAVWRYWALAKGGRIDVLLREFRDQWYNAPSVQLNHVLAEFLDTKPDTTHQWSHASIAPLFSLFMDIAGIKPLKAGFTEVEIAPQLGDIDAFSITNYTIHGGIKTDFKQRNGQLETTIVLPNPITGFFIWKKQKIALKSGKNEFIL